MAGLSKSAASRRFVTLSAARLKEWMAHDLSGLGLLVIQIDGIHMDEDMTLMAAIGVDANGNKHQLGLLKAHSRSQLTETGSTSALSGATSALVVAKQSFLIACLLQAIASTDR